MWFALAACGSVLLLATTNQVTQNVAAVPLLWGLPLALYLVSPLHADTDELLRGAGVAEDVSALVAELR